MLSQKTKELLLESYKKNKGNDMNEWTKDFIRKHTAKGLHRWAFWIEGIIIGIIIGSKYG